ncbi:MAG: hypothetical protein HOB40_00825 [Candidatus Marinimicrobia bacterium]|jgi:tetratricopeptide (TPR) repeat protein|nr:hypothetical protein [Candidatus Neomarinimicrobiota bacterium]MBT3502347.1 hypothetical protein [Candidatus Neomarinimicrobiota bacterium]MBT3839367.1 hypothetical protein [Candidatus Neomarinimicrobiota bacterium]MBT4000393.1 hypothetical protein [Candidatus Neomarinimicrobiota bacterium]MBT4283525.1 hypothetical protein [Candidatus Neomarinimicrobiota bacterium]
MKKINQFTILLGLCLSVILLPNCRGKIIPTDDDLSSYAWVLYEEGDFSGARTWFSESIKKDSLHVDGYNGLGWTLGHLRQPDSSIYYFKKYLAASDSSIDVFAGLSFAYSALGDNDSSRTYCNTFFSHINLVEEQQRWVFDHNSKIDYLDVFLIRAIAEYRLALFESCQETINNIYFFNGSSTVVDVDYSSVIGRSELASHLVSIQTILQN